MINFTNVNINEQIEEKKFDILISALGYESRSIYIPNKLKNNYKNGLCIQFENLQELSYHNNLEVYQKLDFQFEQWTDGIIRKNLIEYLVNKLDEPSNEKLFNIAIDISSMNRKMVAELLYIVSNELPLKMRLEVSILYVSAIYTEPLKEMPAIKTAGPVIPEYAGWFINPNDPLYAVVGLGYENGKAIGALEYLDVAGAWLLKPIGKDSSFLKKVEKVNHDLIAIVGKKRVISYKLFDPYDTFIKIRSLIEGLKKNGRVVLIPFGPKLFNALCIILAEIYKGDLAVWRISAAEDEIPVDHQAVGDIISFTFQVDSVASDID